VLLQVPRFEKITVSVGVGAAGATLLYNLPLKVMVPEIMFIDLE
jgi:hypothetical protein